MSLRRILITHSYSEENKGDFAILKAIIGKIKKQNPDCEITISSLFDNNDIRFKTGYKNLKKNNMKIVGNVFPNARILKSLKIQSCHLAVIKNLISSLFKLMALTILAPLQPRLLEVLFRKDVQTYRAYRNADLVLVTGGAFLFSPRKLKGLYITLKVFYPLLFAMLLKKRIIIAPHSFGPFENYLGTKLAKYILSRTNLIMCREELSAQALENIGVDPNIMITLGDMGFCLESASRKRAIEILAENGINSKKGILLGMTVRQWMPFYRDRYSSYIKVLAELIDFLNSSYNVQTILMPQVVGPDRIENDLIAMDDLFIQIENKNAVKLIKHNYQPEELKSVYGLMDFFIGTRMHSVIFATSKGVPSIAISYWGPKHLGIMKMLDLDDLVLNIKFINTRELIEVFEFVFRNKQKISFDLKKKIRILRGEIDKTFTAVLDTYK